VAREVKATGKSVSEVVLELGLLDKETLDYLLSAEAMTSLGFSGKGGRN